MIKKTVLITGCSSGIGSALAKECHAQGFHVIATARNLAKLKSLQDMGIHCVQLDVNSDADIKALIQQIESTTQGLDFLINNAGFGTMAPMLDISSEQLKSQFQTNVFAMVTLTNALLPFMLKNKSGCIVNIGSVSGILSTPFAGAYCASKAAVHALCDAYRMELAPFGIKVITVQPGAIASAFGDNASEVTESIIHSKSIYKPIESAIRRRAKASQERPSSAEDFAKTLVKQMTKTKPRSILRIGNGSKTLPLLPRFLPTSWLDFLLSKPFQLSKLS